MATIGIIVLSLLLVSAVASDKASLKSYPGAFSDYVCYHYLRRVGNPVVLQAALHHSASVDCRHLGDEAAARRADAAGQFGRGLLILHSHRQKPGH